MARKSKAQQVIAARIQKAVVGFRIPMMSIPKLYSSLEFEVAAGKSDAELQAVVAGFPGVELA